MLKKIISAFLFLIILTAIFFQLTSWLYHNREKEAYIESADQCLLGAIALTLTKYYGEYKHYPDPDLLFDVLVEDGHPNNTGCGRPIIMKANVVLDSEGNNLMYEYISKDSIVIYFNHDYSYSLNKDEIVILN